MSLDVDPPEPPSLDPVASTDEDADYRREEIESFLEDGAWERAFDEWSATTDLEADEFEIAREIGLLSEFDFFWDEFVTRVGYSAPGIPEDWREREIHPDLEEWETVSSINAALAEFGATTATILTEDYADWGTDEDLGEDLPDFE